MRVKKSTVFRPSRKCDKENIVAMLPKGAHCSNALTQLLKDYEGGNLGGATVTVSATAGQTPTTNLPNNPKEGDWFINSADGTGYVYDDPTWQLSIQSSSAISGNYLYVSVNGDNATAEKGNVNKPWRDPWNAKEAATAGDLVYIFAGTYTCGGVGGGYDVESNDFNSSLINLAKDQVTIHCDPGVIINSFNYNHTTGQALTQPLFDVFNTKLTVTGFGEFTQSDGYVDNQMKYKLQGTNPEMIRINGSLAEVNIKAKRFFARGEHVAIYACDTVDIQVDNVKKGWGQIFGSVAPSGDISYIANIVDGSCVDPVLLKTSPDGLDNPNGNLGLCKIRSRGNAYIRINSLYLESNGSGVTNYGGNLSLSDTSHVIDIGNFEHRDIFQIHDSNTPATSIFSFNSVLPTDGQTITIGSVTYTWRTTLNNAVANELLIGATINACRNAIRRGVTAVSTTSQNNLFSDATEYNPECSATVSGSDILLTARTGGTAGNSIGLSTDMPSATFSTGATMAGGLDDGTRRSSGGGSTLYGALTTASSGLRVNCHVQELVSDFAVHQFNPRTCGDLDVYLRIDKATIDNPTAAFKVETNTSPTGTDGKFLFEGNIVNTSGPVFIHGVALPSTNDDYNVTVQGRFETTHSTSPVYNMSLGASCYLNIKNSTLVTPHTESISSSGAESVILMNTYSNKATGASVTELVDTLNVDAQVY